MAQHREQVHAALSVQRRGGVRDLASRTTSWSTAAREEATLKNGDYVAIGSFSFKFVTPRRRPRRRGRGHPPRDAGSPWKSKAPPSRSRWRAARRSSAAGHVRHLADRNVRSTIHALVSIGREAVDPRPGLADRDVHQRLRRCPAAAGDGRHDPHRRERRSVRPAGVRREPDELEDLVGTAARRRRPPRRGPLPWRRRQSPWTPAAAAAARACRRPSSPRRAPVPVAKEVPPPPRRWLHCRIDGRQSAPPPEAPSPRTRTTS